MYGPVSQPAVEMGDEAEVIANQPVRLAISVLNDPNSPGQDEIGRRICKAGRKYYHDTQKGALFVGHSSSMGQPFFEGYLEQPIKFYDSSKF